MSQNVKKIGQHLIEKKLITSEQLNSAIEKQEETSDYLGEVFVREGWVSEKILMENLAEQFRLPFVSLKDAEIDPGINEKIPLNIVTHFNVMPLNIKGSRLVVAVANPQDVSILDGLSLALNQKYLIEPVLATASDIKKATEKFYGLGADTVDQILDKKQRSGKKQASEEETIEDIQRKSGEASVIQLVNQILLEAHEKRATDIHFEPYRGKFRLRYRIDGVLETVDTPENMRKLFPAIISRVKVLSGLDLVERRIPQDGRASVNVGDKKLDLRTSILPSSAGEGIVIRVLPSQMLFNLEDLGLDGRNLEAVEKMIHLPYGIVFVTGPTGSGKSTTLYGCLKRINTDDRKIITVEDPVEYEMEGILQVPINAQVGLSFAQGLRSMLRHDPDVMMVGEVRDLESAELAVRIALTGHLVFSTLHTNDAVSGFTRLMDMGIAPFLLVSAVRCFIAQRLIRVLCPKCKVEGPAEGPNIEKAFHPKGCVDCHGTGYHGRQAIYEVLTVNAEMRELIRKQASASEIQDVAIAGGMKTLRDQAWEKVRNGITSAEEVFRVTASDDLGE